MVPAWTGGTKMQKRNIKAARERVFKRHVLAYALHHMEQNPRLDPDTENLILAAGGNDHIKAQILIDFLETQGFHIVRKVKK